MIHNLLPLLTNPLTLSPGSLADPGRLKPVARNHGAQPTVEPPAHPLLPPNAKPLIRGFLYAEARAMPPLGAMCCSPLAKSKPQTPISRASWSELAKRKRSHGAPPFTTDPSVAPSGPELDAGFGQV